MGALVAVAVNTQLVSKIMLMVASSNPASVEDPYEALWR